MLRRIARNGERAEMGKGERKVGGEEETLGRESDGTIAKRCLRSRLGDKQIRKFFKHFLEWEEKKLCFFFADLLLLLMLPPWQRFGDMLGIPSPLCSYVRSGKKEKN